MESTAHQKENDILIIPCWGGSYLARLVVEAAEELASQYKVRILFKEEIADPKRVKDAIERSDRCITVDGCHKQCTLKALKKCHCETEFKLNLTEMGIEQRQQEDLDPEDLELTINSILAVSLRVSPGPPVFPGCC